MRIVSPGARKNGQEETLNELKKRLSLLTRVLATVKTQKEIDILREDEECSICYNVIEGQGIRMNGCAASHQVCLRYFAEMVAGTETIGCPLCRNQIRTETVLIE